MTRTEHKGVRMDPLEATIVEAAARRTNRSVSEFIRDTVVPVADAIDEGQFFTTDEEKQDAAL